MVAAISPISLADVRSIVPVRRRVARPIVRAPAPETVETPSRPRIELVTRNLPALDDLLDDGEAPPRGSLFDNTV
jgi:hypothetical protein